MARRNPDVTATTWAWLLGGAVVAAIAVRELIQKPLDKARGVKTPGT